MLYSVADTTWSENTLTWSNKPAALRAAIGPAGPAPLGTWIVIDVSSAITG